MRSLLLCTVLFFLGLTHSLPVGRLVILGTTPELSFDKVKGSMTPENVAGVLSNLLGVGGVHPKPASSLALPTADFFSAPKTNLLVVAEGLPVQSSTQELAAIELASVDIENLGSFEEMEESARDLVSRMLSGKPFGSQSEPATVGDLLCQVNENSLVLSIAADSEMLRAVSLHEELTEQHPEWNVISAYVQRNFGISFAGKNSNLRDAIKNMYSTKDLSSYNVISGGVPVFDLNVEEDKFFLMELKALSTIVGTLKASDVAPLLLDNSPDFITFVSSSLKGISLKYGESSEQYTIALSVFISTIKKLQAQFNTEFSSQGLFELLLVEGAASQPEVLLRERRHARVKRDFYSIAAPCFANQEECMNSTNSCSNATASTCAKVRNAGQGECWRCKCSARYAGDSCEFISLVAPAHTIFWITLALIVALVMITSSLAYMDPGKDTLLHKTAVKAKSD